MQKPEELPLRRGGIISLLGALLAALAAHVPHLPVWLCAIVVALLAWRGYCAMRGAKLPGKWFLIGMTVMGTAAILVSYGPRFSRDTSVALLAFMLALKVQELRALRDASVVICLGYFLLITGFLYSQTIATALYMFALVIWLTATLAAFQDRTRSTSPFAALRVSALLVAQAVPLMIALFLLFPRVQGPIFGFPQATSAGVTGLSDTMSPGSLSSLGLSDDVAFRVHFNAAPPKPRNLYWRGPVMWDFDGRTWTIGGASTTATEGMHYQADGPPIRYAVTLEPHYMRWMFAIDLPFVAPPDTHITNDYQLLASRPIRNRIRYEISSNLAYRYGLDEKTEILQRALRLPTGYNEKTLALARELRMRASSDRELIDAVLNRFRTELFFYTLVPPELGRDSVDEFLFVTRRGFCEHYASAFVVLMRAAGIPARVVTGYQGGEMNPLGDYMIVHQADAHAWAEVWLKNEGWVRVDPTAAVSPARIQAGLFAALPADYSLPIGMRNDFPMLRQLRFSMDALANSWNQWVLGYTAERQMKLLRDAGLSTPTWQTLTVLLMTTAAAVIGMLALTILWRLRSRPRDSVGQSWRLFCRKLARRGSERAPSEGPRDFAWRAAQEQPARHAQIETIAALYMKLRYAGETEKPEARRLRALVRQFR